ncbi:MAG: 50S ribosomal protein L13 [Chloroflexota bacterium]|nr:50S ribosomal protein L13 [Chloroflexota bacterium]
MKRTSTYFPKNGEISDNWRVFDAEGQILGRLARDVAVALQGKDKPTYTPHVITGDHVVIVNAEKIKVTGNKLLDKLYYRHSGYVGNLKTFALRDLLSKHPDRVLQLAVKGMLPNTKLGRRMLKRLKIYAGHSHNHQAQVTEISAE